MNTNIAFIVEGDLEKRFIQNVCQGAAVRKIGCNGDTVSIKAIADRVAAHGRLLQSRGYNMLVVIFDRESRAETSEEIISTLKAMLDSEDITATVVIGVPDRDIEVWILADHEVFLAGSGIKHGATDLCCEGAGGKRKIKSLMKQHGKEPYVETVHGWQWLKKARPNVMAQRSASFAALYFELSKIECWWMSNRSFL